MSAAAIFGRVVKRIKKNKNEIYLESIKFLLDYEIEKKLKIKK